VQRKDIHSACESSSLFASFRKLKLLIYNKTRRLAGHTFEIHVDPGETVIDLKEKIEELTAVPINVQYLIFGGSSCCQP